MGVDSDTLENLNFVAGSMFIARKKAVIPLMNIALTEADFEAEAGQVDGTLAHALERLFSVSAFTTCLKISCPDNTITESYRYVNRQSN
jgi:lipopolysaccharide biosynthesis protein